MTQLAMEDRPHLFTETNPKTLLGDSFMQHPQSQHHHVLHFDMPVLRNDLGSGRETLI